MYADNIIVFSEGRIVEQGTHRELQKVDGVYSKLFKAQQFEERTSAGEEVTGLLPETAPHHKLPYAEGDVKYTTDNAPPGEGGEGSGTTKRHFSH